MRGTDARVVNLREPIFLADLGEESHGWGILKGYKSIIALCQRLDEGLAVQNR